jgi:uncharacterized membrane protein YkoI
MINKSVLSVIITSSILLTFIYFLFGQSMLAQVIELRSEEENWNGSVLIEPKLNKFIKENSNITIDDAIRSAENATGGNSTTQDASLVIINGFLVYRLDVIDPNGINHRFIVDAGDGKVLNQTVTTKK